MQKRNVNSIKSYKNIASNKNSNYNVITDYANHKKYFQKVIKNITEEKRNMIKNEQEILKILQKYKYFPKIIDINDKQLSITYEYIEGYNLENIRYINTKKAIKIIIKILNILKIIHSLNIVHSDIKLSNIIINKEEIYLIDFGIARYQGNTSFKKYASIRYCSPEQYRQLPLDSRSDIYSVGIILFELVTETQIFKNEKKENIIKNKLSGHLPKIRDYILNIDPEIEKIYSKATEVELCNRYQCVQDMEKDLLNIYKK